MELTEFAGKHLDVIFSLAIFTVNLSSGTQKDNASKQ